MATLSSFIKAWAPEDRQASLWWVTMRGGLPPRPWLLSPWTPPCWDRDWKAWGEQPGAVGLSRSKDRRRMPRGGAEVGPVGTGGGMPPCFQDNKCL